MKQKKSVLTAVIIAIFLGFSGCGDSQTQTTENEQRNHQGTDHSMILTQEETRQVLVSYLNIKDALVQTDGESANVAAKGLLDNLGKKSGKLLDKIRNDTKRIQETKDTEQQRSFFNPLSDNMYEMLKNNSANENTIYRQYCPMANDNQGAYWLSASSEIMNPYFGDLMLHCGKVSEEL